jgi:hypothetical protein
MLEQIRNDQLVIKEQLFRMNAATQSGSSSSSLSTAPSSTVTDVDDEYEYVDNYEPKTKSKTAKPKRSSSRSHSILAALKSEKNAIDSSRSSKSSIISFAFKPFIIACCCVRASKDLGNKISFSRRSKE